MIRNIAIALIFALLIEIPAAAAPEARILNDLVTIWSGRVELSNDVIVPDGHILIIEPGTQINCVYSDSNSQISPKEWRIIVKGDLICGGQPERAVVIDTMPYGLHTVRLPVSDSVEKITIAPMKVDTEKIRSEFGVFRLQYLALWLTLFGGVFYAIRSRKD
ncbi:MAG: hypothetical protein JW782_06085 [Candidatus Saganbacteria bacterium]|nr:hypothetical protein [Candidatus Saganbacteria bacterium]